MTLGYQGDLYILAFDHRGSFQKKFFGIAGEPTPEEANRISDAKSVIYEGLLRAVQDGAPKEAAGLLVDEQFGADIVRKGKAEGIKTAMPVEKSGQDEFDFQYGDDFGKHIEEFDPDFSKVLVRYNPKGDPAMNRRQTDRLKRLGDWLHEHDRKFLFELLVPAESSQLDRVGGDTGRYDKEVRPELMQRAIADLQDQGVEADIWKIEGIDERADCERIAQQVRTGGRDQVVCVVLGRGADDAAVEHWLKTGAGVPGYVGFAIGRTIWWDALKAYVDKESDRSKAADIISQRYRHMIDVYSSAAKPA
ncbi:MAG: 2-deoxy-5-keto-D-gluconate 6-phosphate aldolase domain-containing protein [Actinomycetota bacterium]